MNALNSLTLPAKYRASTSEVQNRRVAGGQLPRLVRSAQALTQFEAGVEHVAQQPLGQRRNQILGAGCMQDHQVDVGIGRHVATPVAPQRHQRKLRTNLLRALGIQVGQRRFVQIEHDRVDQVGQAGAHLDAGRTGFVLLADLVPSVHQPLPRGQ